MTFFEEPVMQTRTIVANPEVRETPATGCCCRALTRCGKSGKRRAIACAHEHFLLTDGEVCDGCARLVSNVICGPCNSNKELPHRCKLQVIDLPTGG